MDQPLIVIAHTASLIDDSCRTGHRVGLSEDPAASVFRIDE
jgi:hypothetical protein